jgi:hypothetical protein
LPQGKQAPEFIKKPDIALKLIDKWVVLLCKGWRIITLGPVF